MDVKVKPDYDEGYRLYQAGLSLAKVGEILGVSDVSVLKAFRKKGLVRRGANFTLPENFTSPLLNNA